jgi:hypothetical protein
MVKDVMGREDATAGELATGFTLMVLRLSGRSR